MPPSAAMDAQERKRAWEQRRWWRRREFDGRRLQPTGIGELLRK